MLAARYDSLVSTSRGYLHGLLDGLPWNDARGLDAHTLPGLGVKGPCSINGVSQSIDNTAKKLRADRDVDNGACPLDNVTCKQDES